LLIGDVERVDQPPDAGIALPAAFVSAGPLDASADRRYHQEQRADGAESGEQACDLDPAKQRRDPGSGHAAIRKIPAVATGRCDGV